MSDLLPATTVELLYSQYAARIRSHCRRMLRDTDDADDVVQEVFVRLLTRGGGFRGDAQWSTWLFRVATNLCLNRVRDGRRHATSLAREAYGERSEASPAARVVSRGALVSLMGGLDTSTRRITVEHYVYDVDQAEIGRRVGLTRVSVNRRLARVRQAAHHLLDTRPPRAAASAA